MAKLTREEGRRKKERNGERGNIKTIQTTQKPHHFNQNHFEDLLAKTVSMDIRMLFLQEINSTSTSTSTLYGLSLQL
jgi:hypothetical protein